MSYKCCLTGRWLVKQMFVLTGIYMLIEIYLFDLEVDTKKSANIF